MAVDVSGGVCLDPAQQTGTRRPLPVQLEAWTWAVRAPGWLRRVTRAVSQDVSALCFLDTRGCLLLGVAPASCLQGGCWGSRQHIPVPGGGGGGRIEETGHA